MKKKGFTLIELLAVIVILAVVALIAVPIILNVIEKSKEGSFKDSVMNAMNSVEYYMIEKKITNYPEEGISVSELKMSKSKLVSGRILKNTNKKLVALNITDGEYCAQGLINNLTITKGECESIKPVITLTTNDKVIKITGTDAYGIIAYNVTNSSEIPTEWIEIEETTNFVLDYETTEENDYYVYLKNKYNEIGVKVINMPEELYCAYETGQVWNFDYTGGEQEFTIPCKGNYKLETWGAQGGGAGGAGGYSTGSYKMLSDNKIYIVIGGQGGRNGGGYNGGGKGQYVAGSVSPSAYGGGGATYMALTNRGLLSSYNNYGDEVLIVSGAGGGGSENGKTGGYGGGINGGNGSGTCYSASGGTQTSGGSRGDSDAVNGSFGIGGSSPNGTNKSGTYGAGGGGAGWYGGGGSSYKGGSSCAGGGAGGSGYIGNLLLYDKLMYCYNCTESNEVSTKTISTTCHSTIATENCAKEGNGYARITYLGI